MDSLTQLTFGAAVAEKIIGKEVGRKALVWGAIIGTLPDLDVLIPMGGPVNDFVYHRGFSHSFFLLALLSPILAWIITLIHPKTKNLYKKWWLMTFVVLESAVFIDLLTIYGTQILWPFDKTPLAIPAFFIIDPLFTLPILFGTFTALVLRRTKPLGHKLNTIGLMMSLAYMTWAIFAGQLANYQVKTKLAQQNVTYEKLISSAAPLNTLLWRFVGVTDDEYFEVYHSLLDGDTSLFVDYYPRNIDLKKGLEDHPPVQKLEHFTRGFYAFSELDGNIVMTDLRMGSEPNYVFTFKVAQRQDSLVLVVKDEQLRTPRGLNELSWLWDRIWSPISP